MSARHRAGDPDSGDSAMADELEHDRRVERRVLWKAVVAVLVVVIVVIVRQRYFL